MLTREFILEYRRDVTAQNYGAKLIDKIKRDQSAITLGIISQEKLQNNSVETVNKILEEIEKVDPTRNKEYTQWLARLYANTAIILEDLLSVSADAIKKFHALKSANLLSAEERDINKFKDLQSLMTALAKYKLPEQQREKEEPRHKVVYKTSDVTVIVPENEAAARKFGSIHWCTASYTNNRFKVYNERGPLYIFIPQREAYENEKYQLHVENLELMDERNRFVSVEKILARFPNIEKFIRGIPGIDKWAMFADKKELHEVTKTICQYGIQCLKTIMFYEFPDYFNVVSQQVLNKIKSLSDDEVLRKLDILENNIYEHFMVENLHYFVFELYSEYISIKHDDYDSLIDDIREMLLRNIHVYDSRITENNPERLKSYYKESNRSVIEETKIGPYYIMLVK